MTMLPPPAQKKLGLVIDLDTCVGCHACAVACKEWNDGGDFGPLEDTDAYGAKPDGVWFNRVHSYEVAADTGPTLAQTVLAAAAEAGVAPVRSGGGTGSGCGAAAAMTVHFPRSCLHCEKPACVTVCPTGASFKRVEDGIVLVNEDTCIGCQLCAWACPYGAREFSTRHGTMQKCTLCIDRIYNESLAPEDRQPACVKACPTRARHFGDLGDPESAVSRLVAERQGYALMPELGYQPVNRYLPPRPRRAGAVAEETVASDAGEAFDAASLPPLLRWLDRVLSR